MSEKLLPCPFCGRSDTMCFSNNHEECDDDIDVPTMYIVVCSMHDGGCGAHSGYYETKWEAAAAWNRRAERTCQIVVSIDRSPASYGGRVHRCSSCGKALPKALFRNGWTQLDYCPRCGARVTEVVRDAN